MLNDLENWGKRYNMDSLALYIMTEREADAERKFRDKHYKKCNNGHHYCYELIGSGLGVCLIVKCPFCGKTKDITDPEKW